MVNIMEIKVWKPLVFGFLKSSFQAIKTFTLYNADNWITQLVTHPSQYFQSGLTFEKESWKMLCFTAKTSSILEWKVKLWCDIILSGRCTKDYIFLLYQLNI